LALTSRLLAMRAWWALHRRRVLAATVVALVGAAFWFERYPRLRVVNTRAEPLLLVVDGRRRVTLAPTSTESPDAGVELRLSPGFHKLAAFTLAGEPVDELSPNFPPNSSYLLAPGESDQCFWVEHTAYGQAQPELPPLRRLPPEQRLWPVPDEVDAWFFPTPPASQDRRSSGGTRTAVRQARCGFDPWR